MLKKWSMGAVALALGSLLSLAGPAFAADAGSEPVRLSFLGGYLEKHPVTTEVFQTFMAAAEKQFGGRLIFKYFTTNSLYSETEAYAAVSDGRADMGQIRPALFPEKTKLLGVVALPGMCPNALVGSLVVEDLIRKFPEVRAELPGNTVHFTSWASDSYQIHSVKPIRTREDLKGKKIAVWDNPTLEIVKALGAQGVRMSSTDTFLALSRGMVDGVLCPTAPLRSYKLTSDAKYHLILGLGVNTFIEEINRKSWDSLPADMKKWISDQGGMKMAEAIGKSLEKGAMDDVEWMKSQGHEFIVLNDEERSEFLAPLDVLVKEWHQQVCRTVNPKVVDKVYTYARERSKYYTEQVHAGKYGDYGL